MAKDNKQVMSYNIELHLAKKGVTRKEAATAMGLSYSTFGDWCSGRAYPRIDKIEMMAHYFGCDKKDLIEKMVWSDCLEKNIQSIHKDVQDNKPPTKKTYPEVDLLNESAKNLNYNNLMLVLQLSRALEKKQEEGE